MPPIHDFAYQIIAQQKAVKNSELILSNKSVKSFTGVLHFQWFAKRLFTQYIQQLEGGNGNLRNYVATCVSVSLFHDH